MPNCRCEITVAKRDSDMQLHGFGGVRAWRSMLGGRRCARAPYIPSEQPPPAVVAMGCVDQAVGNQRLALRVASRHGFRATNDRQGRCHTTSISRGGPRATRGVACTTMQRHGPWGRVWKSSGTTGCRDPSGTARTAAAHLIHCLGGVLLHQPLQRTPVRPQLPHRDVPGRKRGTGTHEQEALSRGGAKTNNTVPVHACPCPSAAKPHQIRVTAPLEPNQVPFPVSCARFSVPVPGYNRTVRTPSPATAEAPLYLSARQHYLANAPRQHHIANAPRQHSTGRPSQQCERSGAKGSTHNCTIAAPSTTPTCTAPGSARSCSCTRGPTPRSRGCRCRCRWRPGPGPTAWPAGRRRAGGDGGTAAPPCGRQVPYIVHKSDT